MWAVAGKSRRLPPGLTWQQFEEIVCLLRFSLKPWERAELGAHFGTWLWPVSLAMDKVAAESAKPRKPPERG